MLIINKADLAPHVEVDLEVMDRDAARMRAGRPHVFTDLKRGRGIDEIVAFLEHAGGLERRDAAE